jgi:hypothetical protein
VLLWDSQSGSVIHRLEGHDGGATSLAWLPDGRQVLTGSKRGVIRLWDAAGGKEVRRFLGHDPKADVMSLAVSPDGRYVLSGASDNSIRLWDAATGKEVQRFVGHTSGVFGVALSPDGRRALSCGWDKTVRLWDVSTARELKRFTGHGEHVWDVAFTPDGRYALSGSADKTLRLWRLPFAPLLVGAPLRIEPPTAAEKPPETTPEKPSEKGSDGRAPVPARDALDEAEKQLRDTYRSEYAQRKPEEVLALAGKLLQRGQRPAETPALHFALLHESGSLAAQVPDLPATQQAVDALIKLYAVSSSSLKVDFLTVAARSARQPAAHKAVAEGALTAAEEAIAADDYPAALKLLAVAGSAGSKSGNPLLHAASTRRTAAAGRLQKEYDKVKDAALVLEKQPKDPEANRTMGKFQCLEKEDWDRGLPLLAQGDDTTLAELARKDLDRPREAAGQVEVAQEWWDLADKETGSARTAMHRRAKFWYRQALPQLAGTEKSKAEDRLKLVAGQVQLKPGLVAELFADGDLMRRVKTRIDYRVDFNWGPNAPDEGVPADNFSIRWRGYLVPPRPGIYTLILFADDGARLYLDGTLVLDTWTKGGRSTATVALGEKPHRLEVQHHEGIGLAAMSFRWALEGGFAEQVVPLEALFHDGAREKSPGR